jgi:hypothetical protein
MTPTLHVISVISNPVGYASRYKLYNEYAKHMAHFNINLITVELAFGDRPFEITTQHPNNVQLRTWDEIWHKENMINIGISRLPPDWEYVAWVDADIHFTNSKWVEQTISALQHHMVVQLFQNAIDLGPNGEVVETHGGFGYLYSQGRSNKLTSQYGYGDFMHSGYAWAARREAIDHMGGLLEWPILGSADHHMALAMIGQVKYSYPGGININYIDRLNQFQANCERYIRRDIGYVPGTITHFWHGKKASRQYQSRWDILIKNQYDPDIDIKKDWQGVLQLVDHGDLRSINLRNDIRKYFRQRSEDSIDF